MLMLLSKHLGAIKPNVSAGHITLGGALLEEPPKDGQPLKISGSAMLVSADSKEDAMKLVESDIYYKSNVWDPSKVCLDWVLRGVLDHASHTLRTLSSSLH